MLSATPALLSDTRRILYGVSLTLTQHTFAETCTQKPCGLMSTATKFSCVSCSITAEEPRVLYQLYISTQRLNISLFDNRTSSVSYQLRAPASQDPSYFYKKQHSPTSATVHAKQEFCGPNHPADSGLSSRQRLHHREDYRMAYSL